MFEAAQIKVNISKESYKERLPALRYKLSEIQRDLLKEKIPVVILIDGLPGSGRGDVINHLNDWMDTRNIKTHTLWGETEEEKERPPYWRYWMRLPAKGEIGIFFRGWYEKPVIKKLDKKYNSNEFENSLSDIAKFEKSLTDDNVLIIKLWLYLEKKDYKEIQDKTAKKGWPADPFTQGMKELDSFNYDNIIKVASKAIRLTDTPTSPWHTVNARNRRYRDLTVIEILITAMQAALDNNKKSYTEETMPLTTGQEPEILNQVDLSLSLGKKDYNTLLDKYRIELYELTLKAYKNKISTIILFEGWDAAGKGGAIKRLASGIDARIRSTVRVGSPTDEELAHHYLWRFWRYIPRAGFVTIYDRSWYGRVLVERVERLATLQEWGRAYKEINDFEHQLVKNNIILNKFWLQISQEEQLRRFQERENTEWKRFKITDEDWRNREKFPQYSTAINDMFIKTSTEISPWTIIPAESKDYARIEVMRTVCERLKIKLKKYK